MNGKEDTNDQTVKIKSHFLLLRGRRGEQREWALMSPSVAATPERNCHLAVDLHMANMNAGSVKAVVAANSTSWVVSERSGNDRRRWEQVNFNLGSISQEFLIILEIVTSGAMPSHVALDNIALLDCFPKLPSNGCDGALKFRCGDNSSCLVRDQVCDVNVDCPGGDDEEDSLCDVDFPGTEPRCSFEKGWCGWNNTVQKPFAWTLHRGASTSNITGPTYFFRFEARRGMGGLGDQGLDDISLSPECFGNGIPKEAKGSYVYGYSYIHYMLTSCGIIGRLGPQPSNCEQAPNEATDAPAAAVAASATSSSAASAAAAEAAAEMAAAKGMAVRGSVVVLAKDPFKGVQRWTAPEGGYYTLLAKGASGGSGATGGPRAKGAAARLVVELRKGETLYVLVGQEGSGACSKHRKCTNGGPGHQAPKTSLNQRLANELPPTPGGGGGGGATYVFKLNDNWTGALPLVVAAGGGGLCDGCPDTGRQHGRGASAHAEEHALGAVSLDPPLGEGSGGSGGGWRRPADLAGPKDVEGRALLSGGAGGMPCSRDLSGTGGFGGGGSGCRGGGGGGGFVGQCARRRARLLCAIK
ncbi:Uncharacterized protein GBIM_00232 [Gryllus bimaculatus]|nr:Uncharacterized protein GBIM_00232 [Gryllus bimaculatus]